MRGGEPGPAKPDMLKGNEPLPPWLTHSSQPSTEEDGRRAVHSVEKRLTDASFVPSATQKMFDLLRQPVRGPETAQAANGDKLADEQAEKPASGKSGWAAVNS